MFGKGWEGFFMVLFIFAGLGAIASIIGTVWLIYEMILHIHWA